MKRITALANKINYYCQLPGKLLFFLKKLNSLLCQFQHNFLHTHQTSIAIFKKHKLEIELDNLFSPEKARELLVIFFKIKNFLPKQKANLIIARHSSLTSYLTPVIKQLDLTPMAIAKDFTFFFLNLPKVSAIYSFDISFSVFLFRDTSYLRKLRAHCRDEIIIAIPVYMQNEFKHNYSVEKFITGNIGSAFFYEKGEIFYSDSYIRWLLHDAGFFEVLGPFTSFPGDYCLRSRLVEDEGRYKIISDKQQHPLFKGITVYRASTKTFFNYLENL